MGFPTNIPRNLPVESDIIIGIIDSGIWPESESFDDRGLSPPPSRWKGPRAGAENFTCNNKLIGARYYTMSSPRDDTGHGSHTASIAAVRPVGVSFYDIAGGIARGGIPSARIVVYKACKDDICHAFDTLSAFDNAIEDDIDMISISIAETVAHDLASDTIAIGALHASIKGILVIQTAWNNGEKATVSSVAPSIFSVAASSTDRSIITKITLGDEKIYNGKPINSFNLHGTSFPIVYGDDGLCQKEVAKSCDDGCLDPTLVKGNIVMCNKFRGIKEVSKAAGVGMIVHTSSPDVSFVFPVAASSLNLKDFNNNESYFSSTT